jgi:hypothetical protein
MARRSSLPLRIKRHSGSGLTEVKQRQRMALQIAEPADPSMLRQILRAGHHDAARPANDPHAQARVFERADAHRDVDALLDEVARPIGQVELAEHRRISGEEVAHQRRHLAPSEQTRRGDHEAPGRGAGLGAGGAIGLVDGGQDAPRALQIARPGVGQRDLARRALQKLDAKPFFKGRDEPRHRRGRKLETSRSGGKSAQLGDRDERRDGFESIHSIISASAIVF